MAVSRQAHGRAPARPLRRSHEAGFAGETGPRARMKRTLLAAAMRLMQGGAVPSVTDVAEEAEVSRATAYRYFPTQAAMIQAAVGEALGPILKWRSPSTDAEARIAELLELSYPRMDDYEGPLRAALLLAMDQWSRRRAGTLGDEAPVVRGNRKELLSSALGPLRQTLDAAAFDKLRQSLSLIFGTEAFVVLKDIWGLDGEEAREVALWAAHVLVRAAVAEAADNKPPVARVSGRKRASGTKRTERQ